MTAIIVHKKYRMLITLSIIIVLCLILMVVLLIEGFILMVSRNKTRQGLQYLAGALACAMIAAVAGLSVLSITSPMI